MALAAFASVFMGNGLEGGLLLAMFNLAHIGKAFLKHLLKHIRLEARQFELRIMCGDCS